MRFHRSRAVGFGLATIILFSGLLAACSKQSAQTVAARDHLNVRIDADVVQMIPGMLNAPPETAIAFNVYNGLIRFKPGTTELEPDLAEKWDVSPDGLTYTFHLRKGVKWHKGFGELTSKDVKSSFDWMKDKKNGSPFLGDLENVQAVETPDDYTAIIKLKSPDPSFASAILAYRPGLIMKVEAVEKYGKDYNANAVGTGPFMYEKWIPGDRVVLKANPDYFGQKPKIQTVNFLIIREDATFEAGLENGDVDLGYTEDAAVGVRLTKNSKVKAQAITSQRTWYMQFNVEHKPFDDPRVRQAVWWSLNRQDIVDGVFYGAAEVTDTLLSSWHFGWLKETHYHQDLAKAKDLLNQAGVGGGFKVELYSIPTSSAPPIATVLKEQMEKVGISVEIKVEEYPNLTSRRRSGNFDVLIYPHLRPAPDQYFGQLLDSASIPYPNSGRYKGMDDLIRKARTELDNTKRQDLYAQVQRQVWNDAPVIPLVHPSFFLINRPEVKGAIAANLTFNLNDVTVGQ